MVRCQFCSRQYPDGTIFCDLCGVPLEPEITLPRPSTPSLGHEKPRLRGMAAAPIHVPLDATPAMPVPRRSTPLVGGATDEATGEAAGEGEHLPGLPRVRLRMTNGTTFELSGGGQFLIGRRDPPTDLIPDVDLADHNGAACGVSRRHAAVHVRPDGVFIEDLESRNETVHNGYRLMSQQLYALADGDELRLGTVLLLVIIG